MSPETLAAPHVDGSFVRIADVHLDVPLYWQCWKLDSPIIQLITDEVASAAAAPRTRKSLGNRPRSSVERLIGGGVQS
jgi:LysR family transcriptional regulator (chromosome initiation inhibitor)